MSKEEKEREARWEAERDYDILVQYEKIKADAKRMAAAKKIARERKNEILKILKSNNEKED